MTIEEVKEYEKSFERSLDDTGINFITLRDYVNAKYIPKDQYEERLKADLVATLTELKKEIDDKAWTRVWSDERIVEMESVSNIIQQKIDKLKENIDEQ